MSRRTKPLGAASQRGAGATERRASDGRMIEVVSAREVLIRCGIEMLTETGFSATGLDAVLKRATIPKGSFYHYFGSKAAFGQEILKAYDDYFLRKLDLALGNAERAPLLRILDFVEDAKRGMARHDFSRGCLVGNLSQEIQALPQDFRTQLVRVLGGWEQRLACCLELAKTSGDIPPGADCARLSEFFWIGWEGAVMRARLVKSVAPLDTFFSGFLKCLAQ